MTFRDLQLHNFPTHHTRFIGRELEIEELVTLLAKPDCRLLTLVGLGGIGKTRLAVEVAARIKLEDGTFFVPLQPLSSISDIIMSIVDVLPLQLYSSNNPLLQLLDYLQEQHILLILDNFEHLLDGTAIITDILDATTHVKLLVTSREALSLQAEYLWSIKGLDVPSTDVTEGFEKYSAVQLFIDRAQQFKPTFLPQTYKTEIVHICRLIDGLPLALELAASWIRALSPEIIYAEIEKSLDFLATNQRDVPQRHQNLRAVFDWSWRLLTDKEQAVICKLSVFRGGFTADAALQVAGASLPVLASLVDKSFVRYTSQKRYDIHELLRQYAQEQLEHEAGKFSKVRTAHTAYYTDFLEKHEYDIMHLHPRQAVQAIAAEIDNIRMAWDWAVHITDITALQKAANPLFEFCDMQGRHLEYVELSEKAIDRLKLIKPNEARNRILATLYSLIGWEYLRLGHFERVKITFETSLDHFRDFNIQPTPGFGTDPLGGLALLAVVRGDYAEALIVGESARRRSEAQGDIPNLIVALYGLANAFYSQGQYDSASKYAHQAHYLAEANGHRWFDTHLLAVLGNIALASGDIMQARAYYESSYVLKQELNDYGGMANILTFLGRIAWHQQNYQDAAQLYQQAYNLYSQVYDRGGIASALFGLGDAAVGLGDNQGASNYFYQALALANKINWIQLILTILTGVGELLLRTNEIDYGIKLLIMIAHHPATEQATALRAKQTLARIEAQHLVAVDAVIPKSPTVSDLDAVVLTVQERLTQLSKTFKSTTSTSLDKQKPGLLTPLSLREFGVLQLIAIGYTNREIADQLFIGLSTVKKHINHIYSKLDVKNRTKAVVRARELNILP